jgi:ribosomal protein S18 acetylase RimI-like enzyme
MNVDAKDAVTVSATEFETIAAGHAARVGAADPLLPIPPDLRSEAGVELLTSSSGDSAGVGLTSLAEVADTGRAAWQARVEHRLDVRLAGPDPDSALGELLTHWDEYLRNITEPGDADVAAVIRRPSRDSAGSAELLRHGFAPVVGVAVRPAERMAAAGPAMTPGVCLRAAEDSDLATAVRLQLELQAYDAQFGLANVQENAEALITDEFRELLAASEPSVWIAELYGRPLGMVRVQLPPQADWARPYVRAERVGYLTSLAVAGEARSSGVGTALAWHAHQVFDEAGADVVLLHHALANPRSTPFWYAQGYRPLWTYWQRRPAVR